MQLIQGNFQKDSVCLLQLNPIIKKRKTLGRPIFENIHVFRILLRFCVRILFILCPFRYVS